MKIALLGASSQIAQDLIKHLRAQNRHTLFLFGRQENIESNVLSYSQFKLESYDAVINFVGVGDPARAMAMGSSILEVTETFDDLVLEYLKVHPQCKYIFLSSGAAIGGDFKQAADEQTRASFPINALAQQDWYGIAKFYTEAKHRALADKAIIDIRVFNYLSTSQAIEARFMITDALRSIRDGTVFQTNPLNLYRDYLSALDFFRLITAALESPHCNTVVDCYSQAAIGKFELLDALTERFGLKYDVIGEIDSVNATGVKLNYYSTNYAPAKMLGYTPSTDSLSNVLSVSHFLLGTL